MPIRAAFFVVVGCVAAVLLSAYAALLVLPVCALQLPFLRHLSTCTTPDQINTQMALNVATDKSRDLQRRIFELERELATKQCTMPPLDPKAPLTDEGLKNRDLSIFYGCWKLDTTYRTRDIDTGVIRTYSDWTMCFDAQGNGKQSMRSNDGIVCEGPITAQYGGKGFALIEPGNLPCKDGGYIHKRQIMCAPAAGGRATCDTLQPETKGEATVGFGRAKGT